MVTRAQRIVGSFTQNKKYAQIWDGLLDLVDLVADIFSYKHPIITAIVKRGIIIAKTPVESPYSLSINRRINALNHQLILASTQNNHADLHNRIDELKSLLANRSVKENGDEEAN